MSYYYYLFIAVFFLIDKLFSMLIPYDASMQTLSLVSQMSFMMLILSTRKNSIQSSLLLALFLGVLTDVYGNITFILYCVLMVAMVFIAYAWSRNLTDTIFENFILVITVLFVKELILFVFMRWSNTTDLSVLSWFIKREAGTLIFNGICSSLVIYTTRKIDHHISELDDERKHGESVKWLQRRLRAEKRS